MLTHNTKRFLLVAFFQTTLLGMVAASVHAFDVAVCPPVGDASKEKKAALERAILSSLQASGHKVVSLAAVKEAMGKLALSSVESLYDAELLGSKLKVQFVVAASITPLAGQDSLEIMAYYLPEGRIDLLEGVVPEGELQVVVEDMIKRLVRKGGLALEVDGVEGVKGGKGKTEPNEGGKTLLAEKEKNKKGESGAVAGKAKDEGTEEKESEKLLKDLQPWPDKKKRITYGADYGISLELGVGPTVLFNEPRVGGRAGGNLCISFAYVFLPTCGCEAGVETRAYFGSGNAFSVAAFAGFNFRLPPSFPLYAGGRLTVGFTKGLTGAQRNSMLLRMGANLTSVFVGRYMVILSPLGIMLWAFGGDTIALYDASLGFGVRF